MSLRAFFSELCSTKWIVSGAAAGTLAYRRDLPSALCILGAVLNALLSKILKRLLRRPRPTGAPLADPGMPSSHAQSLFFFAAYLSLAMDYVDSEFKGVCCIGVVIAVRCPTTDRIGCGWDETGWGGPGMVGWVMMPLVSRDSCVLRDVWRLLSRFSLSADPHPHAQATAAASHRVRAGLHTTAQVVVGALIGSSFAFGWRLRVQPYLEQSFANIESHGTAFGMLVVGLALTGVLVVGSVERQLSGRLKSQ